VLLPEYKLKEGKDLEADIKKHLRIDLGDSSNVRTSAVAFHFRETLT